MSQAELDKAQSAERAATATVDADQAALDNTKLNLAWTTVISPISGIAGVAKVAIGDLMTPSTVMTTVSNVDPIYVDVNISEQDYLRFQRERPTGTRKQDLELILGDATLYPHRGQVLFLNREVDSRTGTIQVRGEFRNPGNVLRPGQYARVRAITELRKDALLIPQQAVSELQGVYQVGVVGEDNKVTIQTVKLGPLFGDMWVVESGLQPGDKVIVDGLQRVRTGVTVAPKPFNDTQANSVGRRELAVSKFFINRPNVAIVIAILTVISGMVAMAKLPVAQLPDIVPPQINVSATYTGADALTIEQSVATPLEQQMNGVDNMLYMMSTNANDGTMTLKVTYDVGTNVDIDQVNTQNRVSQASPNLPTSVNQYGVTVKKLMGLPLLVLSLYSPTGAYGGQFLGNYATINVNDALLRVPGVGQVTNFGAADYAMRVWVKPDQLTKLGMTVSDLTTAVQQQSAVNPAGQIGAEPAPKGQQFTYAVRAPGRLINAEEFGNIIVRQNPDGSTVRLKDVSRIELGSLVYQQIGRFNAKPAVIVCVYQAPGSNALAVAKQVKAQMEDLKSRFPGWLGIHGRDGHYVAHYRRHERDRYHAP